MKYDKLTIIGWPTDGDEGEDAMVAYEYNKSATGVYVASLVST